MEAKRTIYGVAEITRRIKSTLEQGFGAVWIEGELSNVRRPGSGHLYFTVKDDRAQINAVMFRSDQLGMRFQPRDGMQVLLQGRISVYERSGQYQVIVRSMEQGGQGALQAAFEALKKKLAAEGLFENARKRPLPALPRRVGVVTSATGAAIRDILKVLEQRHPNLHVVIAPARVQGERAAAEIAAQIAALNRMGGFDVLIVGRGGGSLEDLWPFNEEVVARAVAASEVPVISAVGHEIDFTISDFVADVRAATPSHAAELLVTRRDALEERMADGTRRMVSALRQDLLRARGRVDAAARSAVLRQPVAMVTRRRERLQAIVLRMRGELRETARATRGTLANADLRTRHALQRATRETRNQLEDAALRMQRELRGSVRDAEQHVDELWLRAGRSAGRNAERHAQDLRRVVAQLRAMNPLAVLDRGYSVTRNAAGRIVRARGDVRPGERIVTQVGDGAFTSEVQDDSEEKDRG